MEDEVRGNTSQEAGQDARASIISMVYADKTDRFAAVLSYAAAYLYVLFMVREDQAVWLLLFAAALTAWGLAAYRRESASGEHWIWLGGLWACVLGVALGRNRVWGDWSELTLHLFALYWLVLRSGKCVECSSSRFLPLDALSGAILIPFRNLLLRLRVLRGMLPARLKKPDAGAALGTFAAIVTAGTLFAAAGALLCGADPNFGLLAQRIGSVLGQFDAGPWLSYLLLSVPAGAYLYGAIHGALREAPEAVRERRGILEAMVAAVRRVPARVWPMLMGGFCAMYLAFFLLQGSYLFSALAAVLPEAFTAAQYARQGFFELCGIMALNFALLFLAAVSGQGSLRNGAGRILATVLLAESMLFAVTAAAKLWLYIDRFGFTPLRLQSSWLVAVLFMGCAAALRAVWTGRDTTRSWLVFAGVTMALLHLY